MLTTTLQNLGGRATRRIAHRKSRKTFLETGRYRAASQRWPQTIRPRFNGHDRAGQGRSFHPIEAAFLSYELSTWFSAAMCDWRMLDQTRGKMAPMAQIEPAEPIRTPAQRALPLAVRRRRTTDPSPAAGARSSGPFNPRDPPRIDARSGLPPDGSDMLVLVPRKSMIRSSTGRRGGLAEAPGRLSEEIQAFPQARLVPIKDSSAVYPDQAMTFIRLTPVPNRNCRQPVDTFGSACAGVARTSSPSRQSASRDGFHRSGERRIRFVSAVTHELRTPLTSLRLYLDLLVSGMIQDEKQRQEYLNTLALESDRLHRLIDNVLDYAKLEKRKKNGDIKPVNIADLLEQVRQTWTDRLAQDGKELLVISTLPTDRTVCTDAAMIQQIVGNLIDNARKYTRDAADKRIWVWARSGPGVSVLLEVEDRGAGVSVGERKIIFKPFRRGDQADSKAGGAGWAWPWQSPGRRSWAGHWLPPR